MNAPDAALVTGAGKRLGRAIALGLAGAGYAVCLHCNRSRQDAEAVAREIEAAGGRAGVVAADLGDAAAVDRLVPEAARAVGPLTLLVNSASMFEADAFGSLEAELFDRQMAVNLRAPIFLAQAFAAQVPAGARDPSIVNIVDQRVLNPRPDHVSYYLSKSGLHTATATLAQALAPKTIRVNAVGPGSTFRNLRQTDADFAREGAATPLRHGSAPEDIVEAVLYLTRARSVTGEMIAVDGGQHLARPAEQ
jgi:NAD(P)-dependent dehydrogenase (short-subunit alcohol dehydrogenase family)